MKYLSFDLRALALMRVCIAVVILLDLSVRISDLEAFYSNTGAVPLTMLFEHSWNDYFVSIHTISGLWQVQLVLFLMAYFFAIMLLLGYRTRLFTVLSWFMLLSLHNRNSLILQGGDDLLRMVLFWGIFMPWGERYSCDALINRKTEEGSTVYSVALFAYLLQICYIYTGSALLKGPEWNRDFTAMYYVYGLDQVTFPVTKSFFYYPEFLKKLTFMAYYFELLVPLLFFVPVKHQWFRFAGVFFIVLFHTLNGFTLFIGMFPLIGIATSIGLLPTAFMDWFERATSKIKYRIANSFEGIGNAISFVIPPQKISTIPDWLKNARTAVLVFLLVFVFDWNFSNLTFIKSKLSDGLRPLGYVLRLDQNWGMFAPGVFKDDGWYIFEGITDKNERLNVFQGGKEVDTRKPESIVALFKNDRWRKYTENMILTYHSFMRGYFCNYYKRVWNEKNPQRKIKELQIIYMSEFTLPDYHYSKPDPEVLWQCD
ncbi:MAG: hypothetical protein K0S32_90 [Bacteroidetes bacterium]|nr:hypothetical protein [Bacteroidota bacterium]